MESHRKVLYILKDYLEPTFVLIFNLEAAVKISLIGWNTYRKFSKKTVKNRPGYGTFDVKKFLLKFTVKKLDNR